MFNCLLFLYFFTLHADRLNITVGEFSIRINNLLALALFVTFIIRFRFKLFKIDRSLAFSLLLLALSILISLILSPYKKRCFFFFAWYFFTISMYVLLPYLLIHYYDSKKVFSFYLASFLAVGIYAFLQLVFSLCGLNDPNAEQFIWGNIVRPNAFSYEPSFYALYMTPFIVMVNYHFLAAQNEPFFIFKKLTYSKIIFINFLYFVSTSTSTFFAFFIFCLSLLFLPQVRHRFLKYSGIFVLLFTALSLISPFLMRQFFLKFLYGGTTHGSFFERWTGIENAIKVFLAHPFFGVGLGAYPSYLMNAFQTGDIRYTFPFEKFLLDAPNPLKLMEPTNVFTEVLASLGIIGTICFITLVVVFVKRALHAIKHSPILGYNLLLSVLVMLIVLQINQGVLRTYVWTHLAIAFGLVETIVLENSLSPTKELYLKDKIVYDNV